MTKTGRSKRREGPIITKSWWSKAKGAKYVNVRVRPGMGDNIDKNGLE